jgi:hypothetical protein
LKIELKRAPMPNHQFSVAAVALAVLLAPAPPARSLSVSGEGPAKSVDRELARIGREIPSFGGLFYDEQGRPNVYLLDTHGTAAAALKKMGPEVLVRQGDYEFARLLAWRYELRPLLALPGVVSLDVDETRNRVVLGLDATSRSRSPDRDRLERELLFTRVPRQAVLLEDAPPVEALVGLQSKFRPAPGGVQIVFPLSPLSYAFCTLGFNAYRGPVFGFVTCSHCTGTRGEVDDMRYYQNTPSSGAIGTEIADPVHFADPPCPPGRRCRWSDSAFAKYDNPKLGTLGKIARPASNASEVGTLNLSSGTARFTVAGRIGSPLAGAFVHKVGRTTGWTYGTVLSTCVDINFGPELTLLCQSYARIGSNSGDSGSPVFFRNGAGAKIKLAGILWGRVFDSQGNPLAAIFSPLANIELDLGRLKVN